MKTTHRLISIIFITLFTACNNTDTRRYPIIEYEYSLINLLEEKVTVYIYGEEQTLSFNLLPNDTSSSWIKIPPGPKGIYKLFFTRDHYSVRGFPFNSDSVSIKINGSTIRTFIYDFGEDINWYQSVYSENSPPYTIVPDEHSNDYFRYYYPLDSVNLDLK